MTKKTNNTTKNSRKNSATRRNVPRRSVLAAKLVADSYDEDDDYQILETLQSHRGQRPAHAEGQARA